MNLTAKIYLDEELPLGRNIAIAGPLEQSCGIKSANLLRQT